LRSLQLTLAAPEPIKRGLVLVVWTERDADIVRIISARWATARESQQYHAYLKDIT
jgi:uncharacterized DUF497 family protein